MRDDTNLAESNDGKHQSETSTKKTASKASGVTSPTRSRGQLFQLITVLTVFVRHWRPSANRTLTQVNFTNFNLPYRDCSSICTRTS